MNKRTLKEQEYQLIALKYRHEKQSLSLFLEVLLGILVTFLLLTYVHIVAAGFFASWSILTVYSIFKKYRRYLHEYVDFKLEMELMLLRGPNAPGFLGKLNRAVADGEKELARMEKEMKDNDGNDT